MKRYYLPGSYDPGSAATNRALSYIKAFSELGYDINVVFFRPNKNYDLLKVSYNHINIKSYWTFFYSENKCLKYILLLIYYFHFIFSLKKGDIVYCYGGADIWSLILKWKRDVKIYVEHTEHPEVIGIGGQFMTPSLTRYYQLIKKIDGLFVITTALREFYISKGVRPDKIHIANITVDPERFKGIVKSGNVEPYIACCGTISNNKDGIDLLIKSFADVVKKHHDVKLYLIGSIFNSNEYNENIQLIKKMGIENSIIFKGLLPPKDIPQILKDAKVLVLCRPDNLQARCGFATKLGEYLLTENPVVLTPVGDFPLFFKDGENVLFGSPDNLNEFSEKIIWALDNYEQSSIIGKKGANVARECFSYIEVVRGVVNVLNSNR